MSNDSGRDRPELIFIKSAETETGPKVYSNVVSDENENEAEFKTLFGPKPKPKINNAECITYVYNPIRTGYFNVPSMLQ